MKTVFIALIGPGLVGKEFLNQIKECTNSAIRFQVVGVMSSRFMKIDLNGINDFGFSEKYDKRRWVRAL
jgi:homoserine dehydrogenase